MVQASGSGSTGSGQSSRSGASRIRTIRAGTPATTAFAGTSLVTTRVGADDRVVADVDAAQDAGAVADPDVGADLDLARVDALLADRALDLDHAVVEVDEHRPVGDHALLADPHPLVSGDRALLADHGLGADLDDALVAADLGAVAEPDEAAELDPAAAADLQFEAGAEEDRAVGAPAPAGAGEDAAPQVAQRSSNPYLGVSIRLRAQKRRKWITAAGTLESAHEPSRTAGGGGPAWCGVLSRPNSAAIRPPCVLAPLGPALANRTRGFM